MNSGFEYYAFISYKREDENWAKWLQNKLETYRLPSVIRKEIPRLPKRIRPIFRDKTDLGAGILTDSLHKELRKSQYLIVISSPHTTKSVWVGKEIGAFIESGRANHIIPFIVSGEPHSIDPQQECFHPLIKEKIPETLGINVHEIGKEQAFIKVAAKLLDLRYDALWNRFLRERRKQRFVAAAIALLCLVGTGFVWDYYRTKVEYYADYADRWGIPQGIVKLTKSQIHKRNAHYRFECSQRKLRRVVYANSAGTPIDHYNTEHLDRSAIQELIYIDNRLGITELKNAKNQTAVSYFWGGKNHDRIDLKTSREGETGAALAASFTSITSLYSRSGGGTIADIKRLKLTRNDAGYVIRKEFKRFNGDDTIFACDANGIYGFAYKLDSLGRPLEVHYLEFDGLILPDKVGVAKQKYEYDKYGNIYKTKYLDVHDKLVLNDELWAIRIRNLDKNGNSIEEKYFGTDDHPCLTLYGYAKKAIKYDQRGFRTEEANFSTDGHPCIDGNGVAKYTMKYNEQGHRIEYAQFGIDGNPCLGFDGTAKFTSKYDNRGNQIEIAFFGIDGNPCLNFWGTAKRIAKYDDRGNQVEVCFLGIDGNLCSDYSGTAKFTSKYNDRGYLFDIENFGIDGYPIGNVYGYARLTITYDDRGNPIEHAYFDPDGNLCLNREGYAKKTIKYDERGNRTEIIYYGVDDNPLQ